MNELDETASTNTDSIALRPPHLVALSPAEMPVAQQALTQWCTAKIRALGRDLRDQRMNQRIAKASKWRQSGWGRQIAKTRATMIYYTKIQQAVKAGYLIVPNFEVEVMAVRVNRETPPHWTDTYMSAKITTAVAELLPPGQGRYVAGRQFYQDLSYTAPDPKRPGEVKKIGAFRASAYDSPDFPVRLVKPVVLAATERAMAQRIFDQIGVVTGQRRDPIVLGQIIDPRDVFRNRVVSFFIAWWLDPATL